LSLSLSRQEINELILFRQHLHQHPKISGEEAWTRNEIRAWLKSRTSFKMKTVGKNGLLLKGKSSDSSKKILVRVDIDALPITEKNDHILYRSEEVGAAHLCGHDGHATIGCGLALLMNKESENTPADIIFQPAEETGQGAQWVLNDPEFNIDDYSYSISIHNLPGYDKNTVVLRKEFFTAAVDSLIFRFTGSTSHAAEPQFGRNPAEAIARLILESQQIMKDYKERGFSVITPIFSRIGKKAYGTSPGYGETHFTLRAGKNKLLDKISDSLKQSAGALAKEYELDLSTDSTESFRAVKNNEHVVNLTEKAAQEKELKVVYRDELFSWGEDFGRFTEKIPGAMFGLGSGKDHPVLHSENYDFPDELIATGSELFYSVIKKLADV
jgi:amidohydrolase